MSDTGINPPGEPQPSDNPVVRVSVYQDAAGEWRWQGIAGNNEIVATSGEGYEQHFHATRMAQRIFPDVAVNVVEPPEDEPDLPPQDPG